MRRLAAAARSRLFPAPPLPVYDSFAAALADSDSYEDSELVRVVSEKTLALRATLARHAPPADPRIVQAALAVSLAGGGRPAEVVEVGGACGATYLQIDLRIPGLIGRWSVVETAAMARAGATHADGRVGFHDSMDDALAGTERRDLLVAEGVLQYLPDPLGALDAFLALGFDYVYLSRTVVADALDAPLVTRQSTDLAAHGPGALPAGIANRRSTQPLTLLPASELWRRLAARYETVMRFEDAPERRLRFARGDMPTREVAVLLSRRD